MKMYLISDNIDTYTGMRLAGVDGVIIHSKDHLKDELEQVMADKEIGILLITEKLSNEFPEIINEINHHSFLLAFKAPHTSTQNLRDCIFRLCRFNKKYIPHIADIDSF